MFYYSSAGSGLTGGMFSFFKGLAGQKTLSQEQVTPVLDKMKDHLIGKSHETFF